MVAIAKTAALASDHLITFFFGNAIATHLMIWLLLFKGLWITSSV